MAEKFEFGSNPPEVGRRIQRIKPQTVRIQPIPLSPQRVPTQSVVGAALVGVANQVSNFINIRDQREFQSQQQAMVEAQKEAVAGARSEFLRTIQDTVDEQVVATDGPFEFDPGVAMDAVNEAILGFIAGPQGSMISNDTLRLGKSEGASLVKANIPKKNVTIEGGQMVTVEWIGGEVEVNKVVLDEDEATLARFSALTRMFPNIVASIVNDPDLNDDQQNAELEKMEDKMRGIEEFAVNSKVDAVNNPQRQEPEPVRRVRARKEYAAQIMQLRSMALSVLDSPNFDPTKPGAYMAAADKFALDFGKVVTADQFAVDLSLKYLLDVPDLMASTVAERSEDTVNWLRSLDQLNIKKIGAEAATAEATRLGAIMDLNMFNLERALPMDFRLMIRLGDKVGNMSMLRELIVSFSGEDPGMQTIAQAMHIANSDFKEMNGRIADIPDDDTPETTQKVLSLLSDFGLRAISWADRDYLAAADIQGFVLTMQKLREEEVFQRRAPQAFAFLEEVYDRAKGHPEHTAVFEMIERGESIDQLRMDAHRRAAGR